jgi:hypothetical protein
METHDEIMRESRHAAQRARILDATIWATGTQWSADELATLYEDYVVKALEAGHNDSLDFERYCETELGIKN